MSTIWTLPETKKSFWHQICACKLVNLGLRLVFHRYFTDIPLYHRLSHRYYYVLIVLYLLNFSDAVILTNLRKVWLYVICRPLFLVFMHCLSRVLENIANSDKYRFENNSNNRSERRQAKRSRSGSVKGETPVSAIQSL